MPEKQWETNLDKSWLNPYRDTVQTPDQISFVRKLYDLIRSFALDMMPNITSMLNCLAVYFILDAMNFCQMYLEAHDPQYLTYAG